MHLSIKEPENGLDLGMKITEMLISKKVNLAEIHYWQIFSRVKVSASKLWPADPVILFVDQDR